jgi:hypothetical protein
MGRVVRSVFLEGPMAKGMTSVKFSPSCAYIMLGYGVQGNVRMNPLLQADPQQMHLAVAMVRTDDMKVRYTLGPILYSTLTMANTRLVFNVYRATTLTLLHSSIHPFIHSLCRHTAVLWTT